MKDFIELERRRKGDPKQYDIIESIESPPIKSSDSLQMHDFAYCPMLQNVGSYMHPVVFNNACSSWREFAIRYGCNGASVYIGTSLDVLDSLAYKVAVSFAGAVAIGKNAGYALFRAQKEFVPAARLYTLSHARLSAHDHSATAPFGTASRDHRGEKNSRSISNVSSGMER